jgi:formylglycine-generating enzyme required for sulfatase activity
VSTGNLTANKTYTLTVNNGTGGIVTQTATVTVVAAPAITSFVAAASSITSGTSTTLTGVFTGGTGVVDHSVGTVTTGVAASTGNLTANTTFTLTVTNAAGTAVTQTATVTIVGLPVITSFTATAPIITNGTGTTLSYVFTGGTGTIDQTVGAVTSGGTKNVSPTVTTIYTLTVNNGTGGIVTQTATVTVVAVPAITSFTAAAPTITSGTSTTLTGVFTGGTGSVDHGVGAVTTAVAKTTGNLTTTTTFTLTVSNTATTPVTVTATATVTVGDSLTVTITGLVSPLTGSVVVTGPSYTSGTLTAATQTLSGLADGTYTITAATVTDGTLPGLGGALGPAHLQRYPAVPVQTVILGGGSPHTATTNVNYPPATLTVTGSGGLSIDLVLVPGGVFTMGQTNTSGGVDEPTALPTHPVTIGKAFYMAKFPCTQAQWVAIMGSNPSTFTAANDFTVPGLPADPLFLRPVEQVSFDDITTATTGYLDLLNAAASASLTSQLAGATFRLPTEVEYEFACRAGTTGESNYYFNPDPNTDLDPIVPTDSTTIDGYMWSITNSTNASYPAGFTQLVGQKPANPWGLYDIIGNVWEICQDDWHDLYDVTSEYPGTIGPVSSTGVTLLAPSTDIAWVDSPRAANRAFRGGSCQHGQHYGQSKARGTDVHTMRSATDGFRVVLQLP